MNSEWSVLNSRTNQILPTHIKFWSVKLLNSDWIDIAEMAVYDEASKLFIRRYERHGIKFKSPESFSRETNVYEDLAKRREKCKQVEATRSCSFDVQQGRDRQVSDQGVRSR